MSRLTLPSAGILALAGLIGLGAPQGALAKSKANESSDCKGLPGEAALMAGLRLAYQDATSPLIDASKTRWIAVVSRHGTLCAAASSNRDANAAGVAPEFEQGLPLYNAKGKLVGAIAVTGGPSECANHLLAWRARAAYYLDYVPGNYSASRAGSVRWPGSLVPTACASSPEGLSAQAELPSTRRNPAEADEAQALHGE
ncbi:MAG TPA: hypothetical protein VFM48_05980 [Aquabacterium sp.]|nr:hypothetical protein [Aquabacterium sp.]